MKLIKNYKSESEDLPELEDIPNLVPNLDLKSLEGLSFLKEKGVPQGCPTSCGLSTIVLDRITRNELDDCQVVMYADDGVIFARNRFAVMNVLRLFQEIGVEINKAKSG